VGIGSVPLLAFDAWEHAYYLQYRNVRPDFVKAMWEVVDWPDVAARYAASVAATPTG
jgi:Fe-Mn family superoxide dismutase